MQAIVIKTFAVVEESDSHECMNERLQCNDKTLLEQRLQCFNLLSQPHLAFGKLQRHSSCRIGEVGDPPTLNSGMSSLSYTYFITVIDIDLIMY
jgi:hypothetical protein